MDAIISYKMCAVKVRNAKLRITLTSEIEHFRHVFKHFESFKKTLYVIKATKPFK
jgi:hypothetical protein